MLTSIAELKNSKPIDSELRPKTRQASEMNTDSTSKDSFSLSSTSLQLEALKASLKDAPEVNTARVLYFKAEIELGKYEINSKNIATKMSNQVEMA